MVQKLNYRCCFCYQLIKSSPVDPSDLNILINIDKDKEYQENQSFYCHINCFRERLNENIKKLLIIDE